MPVQVQNWLELNTPRFKLPSNYSTSKIRTSPRLAVLVARRSHMAHHRRCLPAGGTF